MLWDIRNRRQGPREKGEKKPRMTNKEDSWMKSMPQALKRLVVQGDQN